MSVHAQSFKNLAFGQANPVIDTSSPYYPYAVTTASALPDWTAYIDTVSQSDIFLNTYGEGAAQVDIFSPSFPAAGYPGTSLNPGTIGIGYTVLLQSGGDQFNGVGGPLVSASISQYGTVPQGDQSLVFNAWETPWTEFSVSFDGNNLTPVALGSGANYTSYGVNISSYAGDPGTLEFTALYNNAANAGVSWLGLEGIEFSQTSVPEPGIVAMTAIGGLLFAARKWFARHC